MKDILKEISLKEIITKISWNGDVGYYSGIKELKISCFINILSINK